MILARNYNTFLLKEILKYAPNYCHMIDFGAGHGTFANFFKNLGKNIICIEIDKQSKDILKDKGLTCYDNISEIKRPIEYIYSLNVIEHIFDDQQILKNIHYSLAKDGLLFLYVPAFPILFSNYDRSVGHIRRYKKYELIKNIIAAGFKIQHAQYIDSLGFLSALLFRFTGKIDLKPKSIIFYDRFIFPLSIYCDKIFHSLIGKNLLIVAKK